MAKKISTLPVGAKVKELQSTYFGKPIIFQIADKNHSDYPVNSVTLITEKIICLKALDAKEPSNGNGDRRNCGNNNYRLSNINKWLNSVGSWYAAQHGQDAPPNSGNVYSNYNPYDSESGFLTNFSQQLRNALMETTLRVVKPSIDGGSYENVSAKVFLASTTEVGLANENGVAEGNKLALFTDDNSRKAYPTAEAVSHSNYTSSSFTANRPWHWWLRTPYASYSYNVRNIDASSVLSGSNAYQGACGVRPLCNLPSEILVFDNPDSDGTYIINWTSLPKIKTTEQEELGVKTESFFVNYTIEDNDLEQVITVEEYMDGNLKKTYTAERNKNYSIGPTQTEWIEMLNGQHNLKIVADDGKEGISEKIFTFSKNETEIEFELKEPLQADDKITKAIINIEGEIPIGSLMTVEACNNAFDENPIWENVTNATRKGSKIFFKNQTKTAEKWGFNVRVKVSRKDETGDCYIVGIGGNFE